MYKLTTRLEPSRTQFGSEQRKFVEEGFIRAEVVDGSVCILVEDSGPGIPEEKRQHLFRRYQQSLDTLAQGTGVGLNLCKPLVDLMGGEILLDESFASNFRNRGTRIVVVLKTTPIRAPALEHKGNTIASAMRSDDIRNLEIASERDLAVDLPQNLSVLFVDDDCILRKQGSQTIGRLLPEWTVREAASGETALLLFETESFDLVLWTSI